MTHDTISFEKAFERLEQILEAMNTGKTPLEESLSLFEEAEKLIRTCSGRLNQAEQKVEMLIKGRNGEVVLDSNQKPKTETFGPPQMAAAYRAAIKPASAPAEDVPF